MEKTMKTNKMPRTDSIQELARFWDTHDLTDFEDQLTEVAKPPFTPDDSIRLHLQSRDAKAMRKLAESKGVSQAELIHQWVIQKLGSRKRIGQTKSSS
jgi:hypothetical protein